MMQRVQSKLVRAFAVSRWRNPILQKSKPRKQVIILSPNPTSAIAQHIMIADSPNSLHLPLSLQTVNKINTEITKLYDQSTLNGQSKQARLYNNQNMKAYLKASHLPVDKRSINRIYQKIDLQLEGKQHALQRIIQEDLYLHFTFNPFALHSHTEDSARKPSTQREQMDILKGVERTKGKEKMGAIQKRLAKLQFRFHMIKSNAIVRGVAPLHQQKPQSPHITKRITPTIQKTSPNLSFLHHLVNLKEERHKTLKFSAPETSIFNFAKGKHQRLFQNCRERLDRLHFCHDSIVYTQDSNQAISTFRQLSLIARNFITGRHQAIDNSQRLLSSQMRTQIDQIAFTDLMQASSGMLQPKELADYLLGNIQVSDSEQAFHLLYNTSKRKDQPIQYASKQRHVCSLFEHPSNNSYLEEKLKNLPFNENEMGQLQLSTQLKERMEQLLAREQLLVNYGIRDERLQSQIRDGKIDLMNKQLLNSNKIKADRRSITKKDPFAVERRIKQSKIKKDRSENIKNKFIEFNLKEIRRQEGRLHIGTHRSPKRPKGIGSARGDRKESSLDEQSAIRASIQREGENRSVTSHSLKRDKRKAKESTVNRYMKF